MMKAKAYKELVLQLKEAREMSAGRNELRQALKKLGVEHFVFDSNGDVHIANEKPTVEVLLMKVLAELRVQTGLLTRIKSSTDCSMHEVYFDELLKGQDSTNKQFGELVMAADRIASNTATETE
jgi:hypothetical protein